MAKSGSLWVIIGIGALVMIVLATQTNQQNPSNYSSSSIGLNPTFYDANGNVVQGHKLNLFAVIPYSNQCSLPACPSGYSPTGTSCDDTTFTCTQTCQQNNYGCGGYSNSIIYDSGDFSGYNAQSISYGVSLSQNTCYQFGAGFYVKEVNTASTGTNQLRMNFYSSGDGKYSLPGTGTGFTSASCSVPSGRSSFTCNVYAPSCVSGTCPDSFYLYQGGQPGYTYTSNTLYASGWLSSGGGEGSNEFARLRIWQNSAPWQVVSTYNSQTQCSYTPPITYMSMNVVVQNTGTINYTNVQIVNATPSLFSSSLSNRSYSLSSSQQGNWSTGRIDITPWRGTNQTFDLWISGFNTYAQKTEYIETKAVYGF